MVHSVPERNSPVLYLAKYNITKLVRPIDKFPFLISLLASIIKIIILSFCFHFLISHTNYYLNIILVQNVSPLALWYILFLRTYNYKVHIWCWVFSTRLVHRNHPAYMPITPIQFIQHRLTSPVLSIYNYEIHPKIVSNDNIPVPPSCALSSSSWTLCVATACISVSDLKCYFNRLIWCCRFHCALHSVPV